MKKENRNIRVSYEEDDDFQAMIVSLGDMDPDHVTVSPAVTSSSSSSSHLMMSHDVPMSMDANHDDMLIPMSSDYGVAVADFEYAASLDFSLDYADI